MKKLEFLAVETPSFYFFRCLFVQIMNDQNINIYNLIMLPWINLRPQKSFGF